MRYHLLILFSSLIKFSIFYNLFSISAVRTGMAKKRSRSRPRSLERKNKNKYSERDDYIVAISIELLLTHRKLFFQ